MGCLCGSPLPGALPGQLPGCGSIAVRPAPPRSGVEEPGEGRQLSTKFLAGERRQPCTDRVRRPAGLRAGAAGRSGGTGGSRLGDSRPGAGSGNAGLAFARPFSRGSDGPGHFHREQQSAAAEGPHPGGRSPSAEQLPPRQPHAPAALLSVRRLAAVNSGGGPARGLSPALAGRAAGPAGREEWAQRRGGTRAASPSRLRYLTLGSPEQRRCSPEQKRCFPRGRSPDGSSPRAARSPKFSAAGPPARPPHVPALRRIHKLLHRRQPRRSCLYRL